MHSIAPAFAMMLPAVTALSVVAQPLPAHGSTGYFDTDNELTQAGFDRIAIETDARNYRPYVLGRTEGE